MPQLVIKSIVTHPRAAHRDDFLSVSVLLAYFGLVSVTRREATVEDLADPQIVVVDTGMRHDPSLMNFDHHQEKGMPCAFSMVMDCLSLSELAREHYPWYELTNEADVSGMDEVALKRSIPRETLRELVSPIEGTILSEFSKMRSVEPWLLGVMQIIGRDIIDKLRLISERIAALKETAITVSAGKFLGIVCEFEEMPTMGLSEYCRKYHPDAAFTISPDGPKGGWTIHRRDDRGGLDFSPLEGRAGMRFVHKSGFLAKTEHRIPIVDVVSLIKSTITS